MECDVIERFTIRGDAGGWSRDSNDSGSWRERDLAGTRESAWFERTAAKLQWSQFRRGERKDTQDRVLGVLDELEDGSYDVIWDGKCEL